MSTRRGDVATLDIDVRPNDLRLYLKADGMPVADWSCPPDIADHLAARLQEAARQARAMKGAR
ncbi:hypothetical protein BN970_01338 [Mycolicibacterium conceptionense]|uniref:Uncharacterized protein n=1 Tax=Mycolicibacterium conceptionense TaxID=451644 RepID=A0A0U1D338_9MYCO|nr:hypothetical protein [Mycolicibacterium conceptionense]ORV20941.1 hypothetical protein AWB98_01185 [Mycolicibacterium conceptionense]CQD07139.1 hypothetical protein BN970_01338 [Mycolicibacterium conceptionense]